MRYPRLIGHILVGIILSFSVFSGLFSFETRETIAFLSDLGLIFLLLLVGLKIHIRKLVSAKRDAFIIAIGSILCPFLLAVIFMQALGFDLITTLITGAALSLTAESTTLGILVQNKLLNSKVGTIILGASILDDLFEFVFLAIELVLINKAVNLLWIYPLELVAFVGVLFFTYKFVPVILRFIHKEHSRIATFSTVLVITLIIASFGSLLKIGPILGAFVAGIILQLQEHDKKESKEIINELEVMTFGLIIPFFFINIGLHFDVVSFLQNIWFGIMVVFIAIAGKVGGAMIMTPWTDLTIRQTHFIGWGMNSRGAMELVLAELARGASLISVEIYTAIVAMAVVTTLIFPLVLKWQIKKDRSMMY